MIFKQQPPALFYLCMTELWERFGFYVVQGMLVLFMSKSFGFPDNVCYTIQGVFTALAYISPIIGGFIADRLLGFKFSIICGGLFLSAGYVMLALPNTELFYLSLATIIVGNGLFKPNVSSLLGTLYEHGDPNRESGFTIFYIGINLGAVLAGTSSGYIKDHFGWNAGFGLASAGLILGLCMFMLGMRKFSSMRHNSLMTPPKASLPIKGGVLLGCLFTIGLVSFLLQSSAITNWLFPILGAALLLLLTLLTLKQQHQDRQKLFVLSSLILSSIVFWMFFLQLFSSANLFIDRLVDKTAFGFSIPTTAFYTLEAIYVILLGPAFAWSWSTLSLNNKNPSPVIKFIIAIVFAGLGFVVLWLSTFFVNANSQVNLLWIVLSYFFITLGDLLLSPIGLSAVTTLAPRNLIGMMMGVWFVATGFGGRFAGDLAKISSIPQGVTALSEQILIYRHAFLIYTLIAGGVALALFTIQLFIKRIMGSEAVI